MADEDEERLLEEQLEIQLQEQRESLSSLNDVLAYDPANPEVLAGAQNVLLMVDRRVRDKNVDHYHKTCKSQMEIARIVASLIEGFLCMLGPTIGLFKQRCLCVTPLVDYAGYGYFQVYEELVLAIKDAEEGLLHLKRARLLREVDSVVQILGPTLEEDLKVEHVAPNQIEAECLEEDQSYSVGSKCRFRHIDGRWYNGQIVRLDGSNSVKISFLTPTSEKKLHLRAPLLISGVDIPLSSLRKFVPTTWEKSLVGSTILALSDCKTGIWKEAELEAWDDTSGTGHVVFRDDGSSAKLGIDSIALSDYAPAPLSDEEESNDSSSMDESDSSEYEEEEVQGLGFLNSTTQQGGIQTETVIFAEWENHTRGIASKMMANMGYREGMGLGVSGQGMVDPIPVKVLPPKQSLDHALKSEEKSGNKEGKGKKRTRGGKRKQEKKKSAEAAKAEEESRPDVFSLINTQLAMHAEALNGGPAKKKENKVAREKKIERKDLLAYDDEVKELRICVEKLEEMVVRNKKEKAVYDAAMRKLVETRKALAEAEATHASATSSLNAKEKEKKWLKF